MICSETYVGQENRIRNGSGTVDRRFSLNKKYHPYN